MKLAGRYLTQGGRWSSDENSFLQPRLQLLPFETVIAMQFLVGCCQSYLGSHIQVAGILVCPVGGHEMEMGAPTLLGQFGCVHNVIMINFVESSLKGHERQRIVN
jgi:hypothetical protein